MSQTSGPAENDVYYVEVITPDAPAMCAFYEKLHGWQFKAMGQDMGNSFVALLPNGSRCGVRAPMHEQEKPIIRTYVRVSDVDAAVKRAEDLGAFIALSPMEIPGQGKIAIYIIGGVELACNDELLWKEKCSAVGVAFYSDSWKSSFKNGHCWVWNRAQIHDHITIPDSAEFPPGRGLISGGKCGQPKVATCKVAFVRGRHCWGIKVVEGFAGCRSAVGVCTRGFPVDACLGMPQPAPALSWGLTMSPGTDKPKCKTRVEVPNILRIDMVVTVDLDMDQGILIIYANGVERARFQEEDLKAKPGLVLIPAMNCCHESYEKYVLLPPSHPDLTKQARVLQIAK